MKIHVVQSGDNVYAIAQAYGVSMSQILKDNQLEDPSQLVVGQTLVILYPEITHTVQVGETLDQIGKNYHVNTKTLLQNNPQLNGWEGIHPGQQLVIQYKDQGDSPLYVTAYAYPSINKDLLAQTVPYLSTLTPFTHRFTIEGKLATLNDGYLQWAGEKVGVGTVFHLASVNPDGAFSTALSNAILSNPTLQENLIDEIMAQVKEKSYVGVDVDFELIDPNLAKAYVAFLSDLKKNLGDLPLTVAVAPKISSQQKGIFYQGHLYREIGEVADKVLLMTYEWGYPQGEPMAISPITGVRQVLDYAITEIPPEKLLLGINTYGYNWKTPKVMGVNAVSVTCPEAVGLARDYHAEIFYDQEAQAPYFHYTDADNQTHTLWFEDARSIQAKLNLVKEYALQGVGYWNLDRPFPQNWLVLHHTYGEV
ncbi:MAG: glycosyl hydrolase family 18 protein [Eubacteriales bacterium]